MSRNEADRSEKPEKSGARPEPVLRRWRIKNFKSLRDQEFEFAPLTLLAGENSSGKSSVIKSILLLAQASRQQTEEEYVALNGDLVALGKYEQVKSFFPDAVDEEVVISAEFTQGDSMYGLGGASAVRRFGFLGSGDLTFEWSLALGPGPENRPTAAKVSRLECSADWCPHEGRRSRPGSVRRAPNAPQRAEIQVSDQAGAIDDAIEEAARIAKLLIPEEAIEKVLLRLRGQYRAELQEEVIADPGVFSEDRNAEVADTERHVTEFEVSGVVLRGGLPGSIWQEADVADVFASETLSLLTHRSRIARLRRSEGGTPTRAAAGQEVEIGVVGLLEELSEEIWPQFKDLLIGIQSEKLSERDISLEVTGESPTQDAVMRRRGPGGLLRSALSALDVREELQRSLWEIDPDHLDQKRIAGLLREKADEADLHVPRTLVSSDDHGQRRALPRFRGRPADDLLSIAQLSIVEQLWDGLAYLGPLRQDPDIQRRAPVATAARLGAKGESTAATLLARIDDDVFCPIPPSIETVPGGTMHGGMRAGHTVTLREGLQEWLRYMEIAEDVIPRDEGLTGIATSVTPFARDVSTQVDLSAMGVGVSQVLPVLVLCLLADPGTIIMLEQPELHLHPAAQLRLGDFFLGCAMTGRQLIVETHSEHLVSRLRSKAAHDPHNKTHDLFTIYFGEQNDETGETTFKHVEPNELGGLSDWPEGFFDQSAIESQEILFAGLNKQEREENRAEVAPQEEAEGLEVPKSQKKEERRRRYGDGWDEQKFIAALQARYVDQPELAKRMIAVYSGLLDAGAELRPGGTEEEPSANLWLSRGTELAVPVGIYMTGVSVNFRWALKHRSIEEMQRLNDLVCALPGTDAYAHLVENGWKGSGSRKTIAPDEILVSDEAATNLVEALVRASLPAEG